MISINTNLQSMIVQSNLANSTNGLNQAIERMTTGAKLNHAKDNAANFSINTNLQTKLGAYHVAQDNVAMGLDMLTTASESLNLMHDYATRLRDLSIQAQNGTYGQSSLDAIHKEANSVIAEILRLQHSTKYNGINLLTPLDNMPFINETGFIEQINERDTSTMTALSSISEDTEITDGEYSISTAEELKQLATMTNNGKIHGGEFVLADDIDLSTYSTGSGWTPIGKNGEAFDAVFDGNGHTISNLYIRSGGDYQGLFGATDGNAEIKNLGLVDCYVYGRYRVSALAGHINASTVENVYVTGYVQGMSNTGGFAGTCSGGKFTNCYSEVDILGGPNNGGIVGNGDSLKIKNCYYNGTINGSDRTGGIAGYAGGEITNCYFAGNIALRNGSYKGGICGAAGANSVVDNCAVLGEIAGSNLSGKFVGSDTASVTVKNSYYDNSKNKDLEFSGTGNADISASDMQKTMQIGIHGDESSSLTLDTNFIFTDLSKIFGKMDDPNSLSIIDDFLAKVNSKQVEIGAGINRLESSLESIGVNITNLTSTKSTIHDADISKESSAYIRNQILQQAAATLLSTANQTPSIALGLI